MQIKNQNSFTALCFSEQTTMAGIFKYVRVKARELYNDAVANNLEITGPVYWIYTGMDGQPNTVFTLDIVIPVTAPKGYNGNFSIKTIEPIKYLSAIHNGKWEKLPDTYGQLFMETGIKNYSPTGVCREMYIHMDFDNPNNNITEVQVGIN
jgi:effector-binding domain-containing protein